MERGNSRSARALATPFLAACLLAAAGARADDIALYTEFWAPYVVFAEPGRAEGMAVSLVAKILSGAGIELKPVAQPWARTYKAVQRDENVLVFSMVKLPERATLFRWISPLFTSEPGVLIYNSSNPPPRPRSVEELKRRTVCATPSTPFYLKLEKLGFTPGKNLLEFQTLFPDRGSSRQIPIIQSACDFLVTHWTPMMTLVRQRGVANAEARFGYYEAPEAIFGTAMEAWLVASHAFDADKLKAIEDSAARALKSGDLFSICRNDYKFDEQTCKALETK